MTGFVLTHPFVLLSYFCPALIAAPRVFLTCSFQYGFRIPTTGTFNFSRRHAHLTTSVPKTQLAMDYHFDRLLHHWYNQHFVKHLSITWNRRNCVKVFWLAILESRHRQIAMKKLSRWKQRKFPQCWCKKSIRPTSTSTSSNVRMLNVSWHRVLIPTFVCRSDIWVTCPTWPGRCRTWKWPLGFGIDSFRTALMRLIWSLTKSSSLILIRRDPTKSSCWTREIESISPLPAGKLRFSLPRSIHPLSSQILTPIRQLEQSRYFTSSQTVHLIKNGMCWWSSLGRPSLRQLWAKRRFRLLEIERDRCAGSHRHCPLWWHFQRKHSRIRCLSRGRRSHPVLGSQGFRS